MTSLLVALEDRLHELSDQNQALAAAFPATQANASPPMSSMVVHISLRPSWHKSWVEAHSRPSKRMPLIRSQWRGLFVMAATVDGTHSTKQNLTVSPAKMTKSST